MPAPTTDQRLTTLETQMSNTPTADQVTELQSFVGTKYTALLTALNIAIADIETLQTQVNDLLARVAALEAA